jgi:hypothetical protein
VLLGGHERVCPMRRHRLFTDYDRSLSELIERVLPSKTRHVPQASTIFGLYDTRWLCRLRLCRSQVKSSSIIALAWLVMVGCTRDARLAAPRTGGGVSPNVSPATPPKAVSAASQLGSALPERWRPALENYVASVKLGNQTALNGAAVPFATYLNRIHNRLHPIFAVRYLGWLDNLPGSEGLHNKELTTNLEIVLSHANGGIVKMGVTRTSGVTAFDIGALESVQHASPFGSPPESIVSPDGNVYLHWEFHRDSLACSTYFARPFILKVPQKMESRAAEP